MFYDDYDGGASLDLGYCSRCGKNMREESPAAVICASCEAEEEGR